MSRTAFLFLLCLSCSETVDVENSPPTVIIEEVCQSSGKVMVVTRITDSEADPIDLELIWVDGDDVRKLQPGEAGDGARGLSSDRQAVLHFYDWDSCIDCRPSACGALPELSGELPCRSQPASLPENLTLKAVVSDGEFTVSSSAVTLTITPSCTVGTISESAHD